MGCYSWTQAQGLLCYQVLVVPVEIEQKSVLFEAVVFVKHQKKGEILQPATCGTFQKPMIIDDEF